LTLEEWDELEMMHNVFHEDTTAGEDIKYDHIVSDWAPDVKHIEGILTSKVSIFLSDTMKMEMKIREWYITQMILRQYCYTSVILFLFNGFMTLLHL
jgi:hypothetical protein